MKLRRAKREEVDTLNRIAVESEAYWGEDDDYMTHFSREYKVTEMMVTEDYVYILEDEQKLAGFFAIIDNDGVSELELFYIEKSLIGHGYGDKLWHQMTEFCKKEGIRKIEFVGSDDVVAFYEKLGAVPLERIKSVLQTGRIVTRFEYKIV